MSNPSNCRLVYKKYKYQYVIILYVITFWTIQYRQQPITAIYGFRPPAISDELGCSPTLTAIRNMFFSTTGITSSTGSSSTGSSSNDNDTDDNRGIFLVSSQQQSKRRKKTRNVPYFFDPIRFATDENFARYREAELKHGRICMLVMVEYISIPFLKLLNIPDLIPSTFPESIIRTIQYSTTIEDYTKVILTCFVLETIVFIQREPTSMPGDYGTGYWGLRDKSIHENELVIELEHGRLCMISFVVAVVFEIVTSGKSWTEQWIALLKFWVEQF